MLMRYSGIVVAMLMFLVAPIRAASFIGTVVDEADKPLRDVKVWAVALSEKASLAVLPYKPLLTDAKGEFSLPLAAGARPRVYIAIVAAPGIAPQYPECIVAVTSWKIMLKKVGRRQSGKVVDREGRPLSGVRVRAVQKIVFGSSTPPPILPLLPDGSGAFEAVTDANGVWTHADVDYFVHGWTISDPRYLTDSPTSGQDLVARPAAQLTGRVLGIDGKPREGVMVVVLPRWHLTGFPAIQAHSQRDGTFLLGGLDKGIWTVIALVPEGDAVLESRVVHIMSETTESLGVLALQAGVLVEGRVVEKGTGRGVPNIRVRQFGRPEAFFTTVTDARGRWFWRTVPGPAILTLTGGYTRFRVAEPLSFIIPAGKSFTVPTVELIPNRPGNLP